MTDNKPLLFANPYQGCQKANLEPTRFNTDCDTDEYNFIKLIRPMQGTMAITVNTLFHKLCVELKRRNIVDITSRKQFEHFVANCILHLTDEPAGELTTNQAYYNGYNACYTRYRTFMSDALAATLAGGTNSTVGGTVETPNGQNVSRATAPASAVSENITNKQSDLPSGGKTVKRGKSNGRK
jgi:hypothetical protein